MRAFKLPFLLAETPIENAFRPMIERGVSGIVVGTQSGYRLLHFSQLKAAFDSGVRTVGDITGHVDLALCLPNSERVEMEAVGSSIASVQEIEFAPGSEYCLLNVDSGSRDAVVCSRHELWAEMYLAPSPGYCCDRNPAHTYPSLQRRSDNCCVVLGCVGHIP